MQHVPTTVEEQIIAKLILEQCSWENLPKRIQVLVSSKDEWYNKVKEHCIKKRLPWNDCFARKTCKESEYYEDMMRYLRKSLALFPYHLSEYVCRIMRISPFKYYCDMLYEVMRNEQPYDHIPNFSAADALRLTGIGRNEFIDIMNKCRSKKIMWKINKSIVKEMLPTQPTDFPIESWWGVCLVNFTLEEFRGLTEEETATIDKMCKEEANSFVLFDPSIIRGLYRRGLVYFDVPIFADDRLKVSKLEGFVSNREQSYEDPTEELLYALFVVSSEHATVAQLATTLQADLHHLQAAASVACRLGWAVKVIDPASILQDTSVPGSPSSLVNEDEDGILSTTFPDISNERNSELQADTFMGDNGKVVPSVTRAAFIVDANITSYLMMGSLSPGLKSHAVTLYEAGKLEDASVAELCQNLLTLEGTKYEGELQEFANHAFSLRYALECLRSGGFEKNPSVGDTSSGNENREETNLKDMQYEELTKTKIPDMPSNEHGVSETMSSDHSDMISVDLASENVENSHIAFDQKNCVKQRRKYRLDLLRCESLAGLAPTTLNRLFQRDYSIIVSMIPLPSSVLPGSASLVNFGPPAYAAMTPWMKLMLYVAAGAGPLSVSLMKGQRLRVLPPPLEVCEKALLWAWDGSAVGGLGNKFEGSLVDGGILLHCLNSLLRYSAVLVQPLARTELSESGKPVTKDIPLPLHNLNGSYTVLGKDIGISSEELSQVNSTLVTLEKELHLWNVGYIRLIRLHKAEPNECSAFRWVPLGVEFGIPLFSPSLCRMICDRVTRSEILQAKSFEEHHEAMLTLRRRLFDFCAKYQATGPVSKSVYNGDYSEMRKPETDFNNVVKIEIDQGLSKVCQNQHSKVLSFEGSLSRTYAFPPEYHPDTKLEEDVTITIDAMSKGKTDKPNDSERNEVTLPGLNLLFDGYLLRPFDISSCLQGRLPIGLIAEAAKSSALLQTRGS